MLFSFFKSRRRRKLLAEPFPARWSGCLENDVFFHAFLSADERARLEGLMKVFIPEKEWIGCQGVEVTDRMKAVIAAHACLLILNLDADYFGSVNTVLVYPDTYQREDRDHGPEGVVTEDAPFLGEAWHRGPIILSWEDALAAAHDETGEQNVVLHEFAHALDALNGAVDGAPPFPSRADAARYAQVVDREYKDLVARTDRGEQTFLDPYGASDVSEFFAVAVEAFFMEGRRFRRKHAELYGVLKDYFKLDPAEWTE
jgi:MtfA peptidase